MPQRILGIDLGAWSIKAVVVEDTFRGFKVVDALEVPVPPGDPEKKEERIQSALLKLLSAESTRCDAQVAAVPGELATTRFISLPYSDPKKVEQTLGGELADQLPFDLDNAVFDHSLLTKNEDGSSVSLASVAPKSHVQAAISRLQAAGIDPKHLAVDVLQLQNLYQHFLKGDTSKIEVPARPSDDAATFIGASAGGPAEARLLLDIGHERTLIAACSEAGIAYCRVLRAGGADLTRAIALAFNCSFEEAESRKHADGFVASSRHPPPSEEAQAMSDCLVVGASALIQDLRRSLMAIRREKRVRIARIDLLGGGSRVRNLPNFIAEELNVPTAAGASVEQIVERTVDPARRPAFGLALGLAIRGVSGGASTPLDLRRGEFQFAGQLRYLREHLPAFAGSLLVFLFLLLVNTAASYQAVSSREAAVDREFCAITKAVIGREICEPKIAISAITQPTSELGNVRLPERSALNIAAELSQWIPEKLLTDKQVKIDELDVSPDRARISGEAPNFDAVDQIVSEYAKDPCYQQIKKGKLQKTAKGDRVEFQLSIKLECS